MSDKKKLNVLGVEVNTETMEETAQAIVGAMEGSTPTTVYTPNSEIIYHAYNNPEYMEILNRGDFVTPDGVGVIYASRILKRPIDERVSGYDLANAVLDKIKGKNKRVYLFGGKPGVAQKAAGKILKLYPGINICGAENGYFDEEREKKIIADIKEKAPDLLFVCLGFPKQEQWIDAHKDELGARVIMGLGGSLDVFAGEVKRAPEYMQKSGLEWFYRLVKQPSRATRMSALPKFGFTVLFHGKDYLEDKGE